MISIKNYFQHTAQSVKKIGLAMRVLVGSISGSAFIQGNVKWAFYAILAGGLLDFILQCLPPGEPNVPTTAPASGLPPAAPIIAGFALMLLLLSGCTVVKPGTNTLRTDSTYTTFKQVDIKVKGATVVAGLNMDSLFKAALIARDNAKDDSISRLNIEVKYKQDSIAALKAGRAVPVKPSPPVYIPVKQYVTDPQTKAQLAYWIDAYGKFQITCESKDQTITTLQAQVNKLTRQVSSTVVAVPKTPVWAKVVMWIEGVLLLICVIILIIKTIL